MSIPRMARNGQARLVISGTPHFAPLLRQWRRAQRLSQDQLALRAGINRSTLSRWERGMHQPSGSELEAILAALQATPEEVQQAYNAVQAPRTQRHTQVRIALPAVVAEFHGDIRSPVGGDLLRAMRRRRQKTQDEVARAVGVQRTTLARWETSETWPVPTQLHALCWELKAYPEEVAALTVGRFSPLAAWQDAERVSTDLEEFIQQMDCLRGSCTPAAQEALSDLHHLIHLGGLWSLHRAGNPHAMRFLTYRYAGIGQFLLDRGRIAEAAEYAETALRLQTTASESSLWVRVSAMLVLAEWEVYGDGLSIEARRDLTLAPIVPNSVSRVSPPKEFRFRRGIRLLRSLIESDLIPELQTWVLAHFARYHAGDNQDSVAASLAEKAARVLQEDKLDRAWEIRARRQLQARILIHGGQAADALNVISESAIGEMYQSIRGDDSLIGKVIQEATLIRISALLHTGNRQEAQTLLQQSHDRVTHGEWTPLPPAWESLTPLL